MSKVLIYIYLVLSFASTELDEEIIQDLDLIMNLEYVEDDSIESYENISDEDFKKVLESSKEKQE